MRMIILACSALLTICPNPDIRFTSRSTSSIWPPPPNSHAVGKVVGVSGAANISRNSVRRPIRAQRNLQVIRGDQLKVEDSSTVKVICFAGFQFVNFQPGLHSDICQGANQPEDVFTTTINQGTTEIVTRPNGQVILRPRANNYPEFLAKIIDARPKYWGSSISLKRLLSNDSRIELVSRIQGLTQTVSDDERRLLLVDVYSMNKRYDRAIEELAAVSTAADDPFIQINLGDLYMASSESGEAKQAYSSAIRAAVNLNDPMAEAFAQHAFGMLLRCEGARIADASVALARAIQLYRDLGETNAADVLQTELKALGSAPANRIRRRSGH